MHLINCVFAYLSPETVLPVASVFATVVGVVMMVGRSGFRFVFGWLRMARFQKPRQSVLKGPHFRAGSRVENEARSSRN